MARNNYNFTDDTTRYKCGRDLELVFHKLEMDVNIELHWLRNTEMVANLVKFQFTFLARNKNI